LGETQIEFRLNHYDHPDFKTPKVPLEVRWFLKGVATRQPPSFCKNNFKHFKRKCLERKKWKSWFFWYFYLFNAIS
jgi:hypothetical protein